MKFFGLKSPDDKPTKNLPPPETANARVKKEWIYKCAAAILDKFVMADIAKAHPRLEGAINMYYLTVKRSKIRILHKNL